MPNLNRALRAESKSVSSFSEWLRVLSILLHIKSDLKHKSGCDGWQREEEEEKTSSHEFERKTNQVTHGYNLIHQPLKYEQLFQVQTKENKRQINSKSTRRRRIKFSNQIKVKLES